MRGLAFPSDAPFDRETSHEYGTPVNNVDNIPIDPALRGPVIDPILIGGTENGTNYAEMQYSQQPPPSIQYNKIQPYSEAPQGDPFAPHPPLAYFPIEVEQPISPPKPFKRKRRPPKERECGFCQGNDRRNKAGQHEPMITCDECGRSGHPTCMHLSGMGDILRSYPWKCIECKNCEICHEKGDDDRILFCDFCDRGWHLDCLQPPLQEPPKGKWHCPNCPPLVYEDQLMDFQPDMSSSAPETVTTPPFRQPSVASSSRSIAFQAQSQPRPRGKGKAKAVAPDESDSEEIDIETLSITKRRGRPKTTKKRKPSVTRTLQYSDEDPSLPLSIRQAKRTRVQHSPVIQPLPRIRLRLPKHKVRGKEREEDESLKGLFDDILSVTERDTTQTAVTHPDEQKFERSRMIAEEKGGRPSVSELPDIISTPGPSRPTRSATTHLFSSFTTPTPLGVPGSPVPSNSTPVPPSIAEQSTLRIRNIRFGQYDIQTWYDAPFPEEYSTIPDGRLWICEFCLKYMKSRFAVDRHRLKCKARHPPGDEIYRDGSVSIFEVDGRKNKIYCQNLCLLSKMFLDHKSLFYDVEPFLFYVMTEMDDFGARFVGYFSKEKRSPKDYNVSCIMTLPVRQRQGWGNLLIDFSYLLSKKEQRTGSPEKPLSALGALGYKNYWTLSLMRYLQTAPDRPRLEDISVATSMTIEDIVVTLTQQGMISTRKVTPPPPKPVPGQSIKFPKGRKNGVARKQIQRTQSNNKEVEPPKGPFVPPTHYEITWDRNRVDEYLRVWEAKGYLKLRPEKLQWSPYVLVRKEKERQEAKDNGESPEAGTSTVPREVSDDRNARSSGTPTTGDVLFPSPMNIFNDQLMGKLSAKVPKEAQKPRSASKSPPMEVEPVTNGRGLPEIEFSPKHTPRSRVNETSNASTPKPILVEVRTASERQALPNLPRTNSYDQETLVIKSAPERTPGRKFRSRGAGIGGENRKALLLPQSMSEALVPTKLRQVESMSDVEEGTGRVQGRSPNGKHTNGNLVSADGVSAKLFGDEMMSLVLPVVPSTVAEERFGPGKDKVKVIDIRLRDDGLKSEELETSLITMTSQQSPPSDDTMYITDFSAGVSNGKQVVPTVVEDIYDADAEGECEEDAEGEPDEEEEEE